MGARVEDKLAAAEAMSGNTAFPKVTRNSVVDLFLGLIPNFKLFFLVKLHCIQLG